LRSFQELAKYNSVGCIAFGGVPPAPQTEEEEEEE
jgi:hypothetical protein